MPESSVQRSSLQHHHSHSPSRGRTSESHSQHAPRSPSQSFHPSLLPVPTPSLLGSVAVGAHYSGVRVDPGSLGHRHSSTAERRASAVHPEEVEQHHQEALRDLKELYCCRPTADIFERSWHKHAVFEDPLTVCRGYNEYAAQWFALPKLCSQSETLSSRVMSSTTIPNRLVYLQKQEYTMKLWGRKKVVESIIVVDFDEQGKIIRLIDQWNGKNMPGWFGAGYLRRLNAKVVSWLVSFPDPKHD